MKPDWGGARTFAIKGGGALGFGRGANEKSRESLQHPL